MKTRFVMIGLIGVAAVLIILRIMLPSMVLRYVNQTLSKVPDYDAHVREIDISLWRGAYVIRDLAMLKKGGQKKYPFFEAKAIDLSVEWPALFLGKVVGAIRIENPVMNFIKAAGDQESQLKASSSWAEQGKKLFPLRINRLTLENGVITFRELGVDQTDLHLTSVQAQLTGITNVQKDGHNLPTHLSMRANVFDSGHLQIDGNAELLSDPIGFDVLTSMENVDLTQLNPYVQHHAGFTFKSGDFQLYSKIETHHGEIKGYVKPLFDHISILSVKDAQNPVQFVWEAIASTVIEIFTNQPKDRFATVIPISGRVDDPKTDLWSTLINVLRNAFIQAFKPGPEKVPG